MVLQSSSCCCSSRINEIAPYRRCDTFHHSLQCNTDDRQIESNFSSLNTDVEFVPQSLCWSPFTIPRVESRKMDFVQSFKSVAGSGDAMQKEGLAIHIYAANVSMINKAFCSNDGDMLIIPQEGRLEIQTEFGWMMVRPGEIVVIQAGMRFRVGLPDGPSRGCEIGMWIGMLFMTANVFPDIQEIFGSHYELPELGPLGSNGMASPRDFEYPLASFELDQAPWESESTFH